MPIGTLTRNFARARMGGSDHATVPITTNKGKRPRKYRSGEARRGVSFMFARSLRRFRLSLIAAAMLTPSLFAEGVRSPHHYDRRLETGVYYPAWYYSRSYIQQFPLGPGDRPLLFRLHPFQHYGRYAQGYPIEPNLTTGSVESHRFPYRYDVGFVPTEAPVISPPNLCDNPHLRRYEAPAALPGINNPGLNQQVVPLPPAPLVEPTIE